MPGDSGDRPAPARPDYSRLRGLDPWHHWEFVRRHPGYVQHWRDANAYWEARCKLGEEGTGAGPPCLQALLEIGMGGWCPDPALAAEDFPDLAAARGTRWASPLTLRWLTQALVAAPPRVRQQVGQLLLDGGRMADLKMLENPDLDRELRGVLRFDPQAPLRGIQQSVGEIVKRQKGALGAKEIRRRDDSLEDYLAAWDAREGWTGGGYDAAKEKRLRDVAAATAAPLPTVQKQYQSAFQIITGRAYDPDLWLALFGPLKLPASKWAGWRRKKQGGESGPRNIVAEAALGPPKDDGERRGGLDNLPGDGESQLAYQQLCMQIRELLDRGGESEIAEALGVELDRDEIQSIRDHFSNEL